MNYPAKNSINNISKDIFTDPYWINTCDQSYFAKFFSQDFTPNTKKALNSDFQHFLIWHVGINKAPFTFKNLTEIDISSYKRICLEKDHPLANSTINRRITHLRMLCDFAVKEKRMVENVAKKVKLLQIQKLAPKSLERPEALKLIRETQKRGKLRDQTIIMLGLLSGLRVSEMANMKIEDIVMSDRKGYIKIRGKRGKEREVPLHANVRDLLAKLIENRASSERVFKGQRGEKDCLTPIAFNKIVEYYAKKAGIKCHPHQMRHTFSVSFLEQSQNDLVALKDILGHENIQTTARYAKNRLKDLQMKVEEMIY